MKFRHSLVASLLTLLCIGSSTASAADAGASLPVIAINEIETKDAKTYSLWIARNNAIAKSKLGLDNYIRLYSGQSAGKDTGAVFAVIASDSFATMAANDQRTEEEPALLESRSHLNTVRTLGPRVLLKAVRFDGTNAGAWLYNTRIMASDEAGYLNALNDLRKLLDDRGLKDIKINAYRVVAGREAYTHLVSLNAPSSQRLAAMLDTMVSDAAIGQWIAASAKFRTVVNNGTYREITP
ncbi:MAG: hypothetical protein U1F61_15195 [Opitutaceae bacterium]